MVKTIELRTVLQQMRSVDVHGRAVPFSLEWRTFNSHNSTGGKLKRVTNAVLCFRTPENQQVFDWVKLLSHQTVEKIKKNPNHRKNYTINIDKQDGGRPVKVNVQCIIKFNGIEVL